MAGYPVTVVDANGYPVSLVNVNGEPVDWSDAHITALADAAIDEQAALLDSWIAGRYYDIGMMDSVGANGATAITADLLYATLIKIPHTLTIDQLACFVSPAAAAGKLLRLGLFADNPATHLPGALIVDGGTVLVDSTGQKAVSVNETLERGRYWVTGVSDGTPTLTHYAVSGAGRFMRGETTLGGGTGNRGYTWTASHVFGVLPDPFPTPTVLATNAIRFGVRVA